MVAIAIPIAIAAATALAQAYNSEKARGATKERLKQMEAEFAKLVPPQFNLSIMDPPQLIKTRLAEPRFDMRTLTPEQFAVVGKYTPEIATRVQEQAPQLVRDTAAGAEGQKAQLSALRELRRISQSKYDPELMQALREGQQSAQREAQSRSASILQDMAQRGLAGSGAELAARLQSSSDTMENLSRSSGRAEAEAYRNRLQALRDSAQLGGQIRGQDLDLQSRNAGIMNDFNARTSRAAQDWQNARTGVLNDAQIRNLGAQQSIANMNVEQNNKAKYGERDRADALAKYLYQIRGDERDFQNKAIANEADWMSRERDRQDKLAQQGFDNSYLVTAGKQGLAQSGINYMRQGTQDQNALIQGLGNAAAGAYGSYAGAQDRRQENMDADDRAYMEKHGTWMTEDEKRRRYGNS